MTGGSGGGFFGGLGGLSGGHLFRSTVFRRPVGVNRLRATSKFLVVIIFHLYFLLPMRPARQVHRWNLFSLSTLSKSFLLG
jgi:hypothetical protein